MPLVFSLGLASNIKSQTLLQSKHEMWIPALTLQLVLQLHGEARLHTEQAVEDLAVTRGSVELFQDLYIYNVGLQLQFWPDDVAQLQSME
ncbi:hypothetical protein J6590_059118 [Homalodisca vitripennis]|nr:hypothetical protein J6590_094141 [Homalodisca vitripennis]KAG8267077.1 hypothetical protein J6590_059118 [Homalodisca vitripennis]